MTTAGITSNDTPRIGQRSANVMLRGLVLEHASTNELIRSRDLSTGWVAGTGTVGAAENGPDGTSGARRLQEDPGEYGPYQTVGLDAGVWAYSHWHKDGAGGTSNGQTGLTGTTKEGLTFSAGPSFDRLEGILRSGAASTTVVSLDGRDLGSLGYEGGIAAGARDVVLDHLQIEAGGVHTEAIVTTGTTATRAGERLYLADAGNVVTAGRLGLEVRFTPKGRSDLYPADMTVWYQDGTHKAVISATTRKLTVTVGAESYMFPVALGWEALDVIDLYVEVGNGAAWAMYRINGADPVLLGESADTHAALTASGALDLCCEGTTKQLTSWIHTLRAYA